MSSAVTATIDFGVVIQGVCGLLLVIMGFLLNEMWTHIKNNRKLSDERLEEIISALSDTQIDLAKNYINYERFQDFRREVLDVMHRIEDKIEKQLASKGK